MTARSSSDHSRPEDSLQHTVAASARPWQPVALYQWTLLKGQKPGIPLIKGIATVLLKSLRGFNTAVQRKTGDASAFSRAGKATDQKEVTFLGVQPRVDTAAGRG